MSCCATARLWSAALTACDRLPSMVTVSDQAKPASKSQVETGYLEYGPGSLVSRGTSCSGLGAPVVGAIGAVAAFLNGTIQVGG